MPLARVTATIPVELVEEADRRAAALDRSRSWVFVDALRVYLGASARATTLVREVAPAYLAGLDAQRREQLEADLALSPEERVTAAERTALVAGADTRPARRDRVIGFSSLEDFFGWERREDLVR